MYGCNQSGTLFRATADSMRSATCGVRKCCMIGAPAFHRFCPGVTAGANMRRVVVLPEPEGPTSTPRQKSALGGRLLTVQVSMTDVDGLIP